MKIVFKTLGCRLNQAEEDQYKQELNQKGFKIVDLDSSFDVAVINTCAVTHKADRQGRQAIRKLKKQCPLAKIVMTGCSDFIIPEVDFYIKDKENFVEKFVKLFPLTKTRLRSRAFTPVRTRANIKIQTGCDNCCTYCITTARRGNSRSFAAKKIIQNIQEKVEQGYKELVLTGVNIGQYKYNKLNLTDLINKILKETEIQRIRLSSINPEHVYNNNEFIKLFKNKRVCRHLHLSLQSGSDSVLKRMIRHYDVKQYLKIVKDYYKAYLDFGFTTDVIVGFPGETDQEFKQSCEFVKKCGFLKIHIFRYSQRAGTAAAIMKNQVQEKIKKQRAIILQNINLQLQKDFRKKMKGKKLEVLFEKKVSRRGAPAPSWKGHTGNYLLVEHKSGNNLENEIVSIVL